MPQQITTLFFEPLDVLVFRDHRPFMAGQHFLARSVFPLPSVFFGALRTALFERAGVHFDGDRHRDPFAALDEDDRTLLGDAEQPGALQLAGPLLARRADTTDIAIYLPWPGDLDLELPNLSDKSHFTAHLVRSSTSAAGQRWSAKANEMRILGVSLPKPSSGAALGKPPRGAHYLTLEGAREYARASARGLATFELTCPKHLVPEDEILAKERRTGIARTRADQGSDPLVVDEAVLYTVETWRLCHGGGFAVDLSLHDRALRHQARLHALLDMLDGATLRLGGKGHLARVHRQQGPLLRALDGARSPTVPGSQKAWLLTPSFLDPASIQPTPTILGRVMQIGGVNLQATAGRPRGPRALVSALAPGTVLIARESQDLGPPLRAADERGSTHGHHPNAGYGLHCLLPTPTPIP